MSKVGLPLMGDTAGVAVWAKSTYRLNSFFRKISQKKNILRRILKHLNGKKIPRAKILTHNAFK